MSAVNVKTSETRALSWETRFPDSDRETYRRTLLELARQDARLYCLDSDMGGLETLFQDQLPRQYIDFGIAEANMMSVAAAFAKMNKIPFVNTMAAFAAFRAYEQVKIDIAYNNLPVRIVATHGGLSASYLGPTHHAQQDFAAMRALPNMTVMTPADAVETVKMIESAVDLAGPVYIRLGRNRTDLVYHADYEFTVGRAVELRPGNDVTIVASGAHPVLAALGAHDELAALGVGARVLNLHTLKPVDEEALVRAARETRGIVAVEDHSIVGGLGSAVAEVLAEQAPTPLRRVGTADEFCNRVGDHRQLVESYGISAGHLVEVVRKLLAF